MKRDNPGLIKKALKWNAARKDYDLQNADHISPPVVVEHDDNGKLTYALACVEVEPGHGRLVEIDLRRYKKDPQGKLVEPLAFDDGQGDDAQ